MKIIHVLSCLSKGGGERVVQELANKATQQGDEVIIIAGWPVDPSYLQNDLHPGVSIKFIAHAKKISYLKIIPWIFKNRKWISSNDVLHCHLTYGAVFGSLAYLILKKIFGKKRPVIIETNHAVGMPVPKFNRWLHSRMLLLRDGIAFITKDPYWDHFTAKHPQLKTTIIPNGISVSGLQKDINAQEMFRKGMHVSDPSGYVVGTVSMLRPDRKPWLYIPIFRDINNALAHNVQFILAGGGTEFDKIKNDIEKHGLSMYVYMPGFVNNPVVAISNMDVYVSLSVGDTAGISMIEAAMCKVPVVGIQMIGNYKAKNEDWVWSHTDIKEVAKKIIFLLQNEPDRKKLAEHQYKYVTDNFTSEAMNTSYSSFYNEILNLNKAKP